MRVRTWGVRRWPWVWPWVWLALALVVLALPDVADALRNPFLPGGEGAAPPDASNDGGSWYTDLIGPIMAALIRWQSALRVELIALAAHIREVPWGGALWQFVGASFLYGVVHAAGPGHGKGVAFAWFLGTGRAGERGPLSCLLFGQYAMCMHVASAAVLVLGGFALASLVPGISVQTAGPHLETIAAVLCVVVGLWLAVDAVRGGHARACPTSARRGGVRFLLAGAAAGIVPCPGAALVMGYAVAQDIVHAGLAAMLAISAGMGATVAVAGTAGWVLSHRLPAQAAQGNRLHLVGRLVAVVSGCALAGVGALLLLK